MMMIKADRPRSASPGRRGGPAPLKSPLSFAATAAGAPGACPLVFMYKLSVTNVILRISI